MYNIGIYLNIYRDMLFVSPADFNDGNANVGNVNSDGNANNNNNVNNTRGVRP